MSRNIKIGDLIQVDKSKADKNYYPLNFDFTKRYEVIDIDFMSNYCIFIDNQSYRILPKEIVNKFLKRIVTYE